VKSYDTKLYTRSDWEEGQQDLQNDLDELQKWSEKWLLKFHPQKCSVIKLGTTKSETTYYMNSRNTDGTSQRLPLSVHDTEKDLGVVIDHRLTFKDHIAQASSKANRVLGVIRRSFDYLTKKTFVQLYKSLVRPILEYGHCVWQPHLKSLCSDIEDVQRRATKLISNLRDKPYPERLKILKLPTLEHRRKRGDIIEVFKYLRGFYHVQHPTFTLSDSALRGNSLKL